MIAYWPTLALGMLETIQLSLLAILLGGTFGILTGLVRVFGGRLLGALLSLAVDAFRSIPLLVTLIWIYFGVPMLLGVQLSPFSVGLVGLVLHSSAYVSEVVRGGVASVRRGQYLAALAVGMTWMQAIRRVILPQALIRMLPPLGSIIVLTIKDTATTSVIAVPELMFQAQIVARQTFHPFEIYTAVIIVYFLMIYPAARGIELVFRRVGHKGAG